MTDEVLTRVHAGVAAITLNRPDKLNAFTTPMLEAFIAALTKASTDERIRVVTVTGSGRGFCAGQDLADRAVSPGGEAPDLGTSLEERYNPVVRLLRTMPKPVIVGVNGVAAGAGANLALAGDLVIAARSARFIQSFARLGLVPDSGGTFFLPRALGMPRALGLALTGNALSADQAAEWGLIWSVVDDEALPGVLEDLGEQLAQGPTAGLAKIKEALASSLGNTLDAQLDLERDLQRAAGRSRDYQEGVAAFMERRTPRFEGR